jgi:flagellar motor switch protein FliN/FliY
MVLDSKERPAAAASEGTNLDLILELELPLTVRLGSRRILLAEALELGTGSVVELDRSADDPVELMINGRRVARGELVVVNGELAVRVTEVDSRTARLESLGHPGG